MLFAGARFQARWLNHLNARRRLRFIHRGRQKFCIDDVAGTSVVALCVLVIFLWFDAAGDPEAECVRFPVGTHTYSFAGPC